MMDGGAYSGIAEGVIALVIVIIVIALVVGGVIGAGVFWVASEFNCNVSVEREVGH